MVYIDNTETLSYLFRLSKQNVTLTVAIYDWDQISVLYGSINKMVQQNSKYPL